MGFKLGEPAPKSLLIAATLYMSLSMWLHIYFPLKFRLLGKDRGM